ncbi:unnamed protein product, partial [Chrysoparadoxa australica]
HSRGNLWPDWQAAMKKELMAWAQTTLAPLGAGFKLGSFGLEGEESPTNQHNQGWDAEWVAKTRGGVGEAEAPVSGASGLAKALVLSKTEAAGYQGQLEEALARLDASTKQCCELRAVLEGWFHKFVATRPHPTTSSKDVTSSKSKLAGMTAANSRIEALTKRLLSLERSQISEGLEKASYEALIQTLRTVNARLRDDEASARLVAC